MDPIGISGFCSGDTFSPIRSCFEGAPCVNGLCDPMGCNECSTMACVDSAQTCTWVVVNRGSEQKACCVLKRTQGSAIGQPCTSNFDCVNQLCGTTNGGW